MGVHIGDNQLVITAEPKTIHFDLSKDVDNNLKHEIDFIIEHNEILSEELLLKYRYRNDINEQHKFVLKLSQRLDFKSSNKHVDLQKLVYLLHLEKCNKTVQKQETQNNSFNVE